MGEDGKDRRIRQIRTISDPTTHDGSRHDPQPVRYNNVANWTRQQTGATPDQHGHLSGPCLRAVYGAGSFGRLL